MDLISPFATYSPGLLLACAIIMALGGVIKGAVGFALPMIAVAGVGSLLSAQETVALIVLPVFLSNLWQTFRQGLAPAIATGRRFWRLNLIMGVLIAIVAQAVPLVSSEALFLVLGILVSTAAGVQLAGWRPRAPDGALARQRLEILTGIVAGICGGLAGVWGPPVLFFLIALGTEKTAQVRAQGMAFLVGSVMLIAAHLGSGLLDATILSASALMCAPVLLGMALGVRLQDRMNPERFRRITLVILCLAGLNLLRRALF
ncbi:MAG: sulfite exporter TauE/SafE family protein [Pseudomonadota bacterium]